MIGLLKQHKTVEEMSDSLNYFQDILSDEMFKKLFGLLLTDKGTEFDVIFSNDKKKYHFTTKLLGNHNVYNILAAIAFGYEFGITIKDLQQVVKTVHPTEHRLEQI